VTLEQTTLQTQKRKGHLDVVLSPRFLGDCHLQHVYVTSVYLHKHMQLKGQWQDIVKMLPARSNTPNSSLTLPLDNGAIDVQLYIRSLPLSVHHQTMSLFRSSGWVIGHSCTAFRLGVVLAPLLASDWPTCTNPNWNRRAFSFRRTNDHGIFVNTERLTKIK
jgi:hypothetical protein